MLRFHARGLAALVATFMLVGMASAGKAAAATVDARQLLTLAKNGLSATSRAAALALDRAQAKNRPFWSALDGMSRALDTVETDYLSKSPSFFDALGAGSRALATLETFWADTGVDELHGMGVSSGLQTLSTSYSLLRGSYGPEALRRQQGGSLTSQEQQRFQALQQNQAALARQLAALRTQAQRANDRQAAANLSRLIAQAQSIAQAEVTLEAYLAAQMSLEILQGEWSAAAQTAKPALRKAFKKTSSQVEDLSTDKSVGFVFTTDLSKVDGWAPLDTPVEVPEGVDLGTSLTETTPAVSSEAAEITGISRPVGDMATPAEESEDGDLAPVEAPMALAPEDEPEAPSAGSPASPASPASPTSPASQSPPREAKPSEPSSPTPTPAPDKPAKPAAPPPV
ncbi:MAG TPA: hypothetical protein VMM92_06610 [Thermoanaerobaculia bacterium]|nr:hypothetical protein [Thermoanaerobaculia bacterium]